MSECAQLSSFHEPPQWDLLPYGRIVVNQIEDFWFTHEKACIDQAYVAAILLTK